MLKFFGSLLAVLLSLLLLNVLYFDDLGFEKKVITHDRDIPDINISDILCEDYAASEAVDFEDSKSDTVGIQKTIAKKIYKKSFLEPTLLIIMDDISTFSEAKAIKKLHLKIVPSIFPKTKDHPNTPKIAKMFKSIMIHLPLEAQNFSKTEMNTLLVTDTEETLRKKLDKSLEGFTNVVAINNHTGSRFTSNKKVLKYLIKLIEKKSYLFIDSKTTYKSKYDEIQREKGKKIFHRDIFLDNIQKTGYINKQIKRAVFLAKKQGFAIAVCHPHPATFKALNESRNLLKSIRLVNIDEIQYTEIGKLTKTVTKHR